MSHGTTIDYDALAAQHGGSATVDYDALAAQHGGTASAPPSTAQPPDTGVLAGLKRVGSGLLHTPGAVWDAFTKPPQNPDEEKAQTLGGYGGLALHRLVAVPMAQQSQLANQYQTQATGSTATPPAQLGFDTSLSGNTPQEKAQHLANMHRMASFVPMLGPMVADMTGRFVGENQAPDKSGAVTELMANIAGPKLAEGGLNLGLKAASKLAPAMAERMYQSALKPSTTIPAAQRANIVRTGLDAGIPITQGGASKLSQLIDDYNGKVQDEIRAGAQSGATVDPNAIAARAGQAKAKFATQVNPTSDIQAIEASKQEFLANNPNPIPVDEAQAMKAGTYQQLKGRAYGELKSATVEAQKALARGIKEELENQFPEIKQLNAQQSKFYDLDGVLDRALNRIGNHQLMGIGTPIVTTAGASLGGAMFGHTAEGAAYGAAAGVVKAVLDNPAVKSNLAIMLSKGAKLPPAVSTARVNQFVNALAQSQNAGAASAPSGSQ